MLVLSSVNRNSKNHRIHSKKEREKILNENSLANFMTSVTERKKNIEKERNAPAKCLSLCGIYFNDGK